MYLYLPEKWEKYRYEYDKCVYTYQQNERNIGMNMIN